MNSTLRTAFVIGGLILLAFDVPPAFGQLTSFTGLEVYKDNADTQLRFHDPNSHWFSVGMDYSDGNKFKIGAGGTIGDTNFLVITQSGDVGIGTATPASALHVKKSGPAIVATFEGGDTNGLELDLNANTSGGYRYRIGVIDSSHPWGGGLYIYSAPTATVSMFIDGDTNNIGIGTINPAQKLSVNGAIRAKEVIVDTNWSDFVFAEDYRLPSLEEVAHHIREHKHLPGVPSAAEIQQNGLPISEAQTIMMQKVEELTLYILQMKRANDELQTRVRELEARLSPE